MKKLLIIALAVFATTAFAVNPGVKKDKKKKKAVAAAVIQSAYPQLLSASDSLSYAAGMFTTRGLMDYVKTQFGIDSTNVQTFIETLREAVSAQHDKQFAARCAAMQIAQMIDTRIYPNVSSDVKGTEYTLDSLKFNSGFLAAVASDTTLMHQDFAERYFQTTMKDAKERAERQYKLDNEAWIKQNATKEGVKTTTSGLQYKVLTAGKGSIATKDDNVTVKYEGRTIDGKVFDSSYKRNPDTTTFRPDQVIKGWTEALTMMPVGSKWQLFIPYELAYGEQNKGTIKPFSTLIFTVELVGIEGQKAAADKAEAKPDTKTAAKTATKRASKAKTAAKPAAKK